jgi:hypothetical protein
LFIYNRLNTYDLQEDEYKREENIIHNIIHNIMHNTSFQIHPQKPPYHKPGKQQLITQTPRHKWATFTYIGKETTFITNIFRRANLKIAFCASNTMLMHKDQIPDNYTQSGVYKLTCPDCKKAHVAQTGRSFAVWFNERKDALRNNNYTSKFSQHLIEHAHSFDTILNNMQVLQHQSKGAHLNTNERFYIYAEYVASNLLNNNRTMFPNKIFDTLLKPHHP